MKNVSKLMLVAIIMTASILAKSQETETTSSAIFVDFSSTAAPSTETAINITSPPNLTEVTRGFTPIRGTQVELTGTITDADGLKEVLVNDRAILPALDGAFSMQLTLPVGEQKITIKVTDAKGNLSVKEYSVVVEDAPMVAGVSGGIGDYYALLIGINEYDDPELPDLSNPIKDATSLKNVLQSNYYFKQENIILLEDATGDEIEETLYQLSQKIEPKDNLLIFYAGHGQWDSEAEIGYWIPSDASKNSPVKWFRNSTLTDQLRTIKSKHTLLIADACFSGGIFKSRSFFTDATPAIDMMYSLPSRKAMTSGTLTVVPDNSEFLKYLIKRLEGNTRKYLPSEQLFSSFKEAVMNNSRITPRYGTIQNVGDEGGDFIFIRRD